jgi:hypothetical protein
MATASFSDSSILAGDPTFQARVGAALFTFCQVVATEGWTVAFHRERSGFVNQIFTTTLNSQGINPWVFQFANTVASDATVLSDATAAGTVVLTTGNRATQQALVTDQHISNAVASQFNSYIREPSS